LTHDRSGFSSDRTSHYVARPYQLAMAEHRTRKTGDSTEYPGH
jgi:hypothetical protein